MVVTSHRASSLSSPSDLLGLWNPLRQRGQSDPVARQDPVAQLAQVQTTEA